MKSPTLLATLILAVVAIAHLLRLIFGVSVTIADGVVPMWVSFVFVALAGGAAVMLWRDSSR
jgi:hypothetical protein